MDKFGVCNCKLDYYDPKVTNLVQFDSYDEALEYYMIQLEKQKNGYILPNDLWLVHITNNHIIQFNLLKMQSKVKYVKI